MTVKTKEEIKEMMVDRFSHYMDKFLDSTDIRTTNGSQYEEKFTSMMRLVEDEIFQLSVGAVPKGKNLKKNS